MSADRNKQREDVRETGRARRKIEQERAARRKQYLFAGAILLAIAVVSVIVSFAALNNKTSSTIVAPTVVIDASVPRNGTTLGDPNAKVTVVEWGDYQCPYCMQFAENVQPQLIADYVKTGKIKFEFKNFPFIGPESTAAAEAAACANDQGKFWAFHDTVYANQQTENSGAFSADNLKRIAQVAGLDVDQYSSCMSKNTHEQDVAAATAEAKALPIASTPSFVIDGQVIVFKSYADLKTQIDAALAKAGA